MAQDILFGVAEQLVTKVGSSVFQEIQLIYGVRDEMDKFQDSLSTVKALLLDADEEKQTKNHAVENWIRKVEETVCEADDLVDDLATYDLRKTIFKGKLSVKVKDFFSSSNQIWFRRKMGRQIKDLTERLNEVKKDALLLNLVGREIVGDEHLPSMMSERETDSYVDRSEVIGREEDKKHMVNQLLGVGGPGNVSIAAIVGFGGLGKTTLAQLVYNDEQVDKHFETKLWVCVSEEFDVKLIIKKILNDDRCEVLEELQAKVREKLQGKRCLLVLDDVWNEDWHEWNSLRKYLSVGALGSKILVTTRSQIVAAVMGVDSPYELEGLEEDKAWELFRKLAFKEGVSHVLNSKLEEIGKAIAKKCKGVPLAIRTLGSLMSRTSESEWSTILENDIWVQCQSRGDIIPVLKLSYDHLPHHLRSCFAYYAMFPKDHVIDKRELVYLWMAQGYIGTLKGDEYLEGIGERYLNELIYRSFFYIVDDEFRRPRRRSVKMHDLMHDLAQSIAKDSCIAIEKECMGKVSKRLRHAYGSRLGKESMMGVIHQVKGMKTLFTEYGDWDMLTVTLNCQRRLRALHIRGVDGKAMGLMGKLKHLRHLKISNNYDLKTLPHSIANLHNLQTLVLEYCRCLIELPSAIQYLVSLKSLVIGFYLVFKGMPIGLEKLTGLETLSFKVGIGEVSLPILEHLNKLRRLSIEGVENLRNLDSESKGANLLEKKHLQILELIWLGERELNIAESELVLDNLQPHPNLQQLTVMVYKGIRFSNWLPHITNLVHLSLVGCVYLEKLPPLGQLPVLETLTLLGLSSLRYISDYDEEVGSSSSSSSSCTTFFPSLQEIKIESCCTMKGWWRRSRSEVEICQFPRLSRLSIKHCRSLACLPEGMHQMTSLQELHIERCPGLSERCRKDSGEDWVNISHIPKIVIIDDNEEQDYDSDEELEQGGRAFI